MSCICFDVTLLTHIEYNGKIAYFLHTTWWTKNKTNSSVVTPKDGKYSKHYSPA